MTEPTEQHNQFIGRYHLLTRLAVGGMAEVFLAQEEGIGGLRRKVVIKRILPQLVNDQSFVDMFLREGRIIAKLNHPNVIQIHELGLDGGQYYLALEYIHGTTLRELQVLTHQANKHMSLEVSLGLILQACRGLHAAHELGGDDDEFLGIVHRDVTPHNIMCTLSGRVKILDFGIAKATEHLDESTHSGDLKGKFSYMSPEQTLQEPLDRRSDVFSMGIILWELLTGRRLYKRDSHIRTMHAVLEEDAPPPHDYEPSIPHELSDIVQKALSRNISGRYQTANELYKALNRFCQMNEMDTSEDRLKQYINDIAGETLQERKAKMERSDFTQSAPSISMPTFNPLDQSTEAATVVEPSSILKQVDEDDTLNGPTSKNVSAESSDQFEAEPFVQPPKEEKKGIHPILIGLIILVIIGSIISYNMRRNKLTNFKDTKDTIIIAWAPTVPKNVLERELKPLESYLARTLQKPVRFKIGDSYQDTANMLTSKKAHFAILPPMMFLRTEQKHKDVIPLAIKEYDGATTSDGVLLVSTRKMYSDFKSLRGQRFCLTDKNSTSGYFLPRAYIKSKGYNPDTFMGKVHMSGDHLQLIRDLLDGKCDVGASYNGALFAADRLKIPVSQIRTMAITGHIPQDVVCSRKAVDPKVRGNVRAALLRLDPISYYTQSYIGETQRITGFRTIKQDIHFKTLKQALRMIQKKQDRKSLKPSSKKEAPLKKETPSKN